MKRLSFSVFFVCLLSSLIYGCGGGGDGGGSTTSTITGTVSGTTIVAFGQDGKEVKRATASENTKRFTLTVPANTYKFMFITDEGKAKEKIYSYYGSSSAEANVFAVPAGITWDMGLVNMDPDTGMALSDPDHPVPVSVQGRLELPPDVTGKWNLELTITTTCSQDNDKDKVYSWDVPTVPSEAQHDKLVTVSINDDDSGNSGQIIISMNGTLMGGVGTLVGTLSIGGKPVVVRVYVEIFATVSTDAEGNSVGVNGTFELDRTIDDIHECHKEGTISMTRD